MSNLNKENRIDDNDTTMAGNLEQAQGHVLGQAERDPFKKRSRIARSPRKGTSDRESTGEEGEEENKYRTHHLPDVDKDVAAASMRSGSISSVDLTGEEEEEMRAAKRRKGIPLSTEGNSTTDEEEEGHIVAMKLKNTLRRIDKELKVIRLIAETERNTKKEIKEASMKLHNFMNVIMSDKVQGWLKSVGPDQREIHREGDKNRLAEENHKLKEMLEKSKKVEEEMTNIAKQEKAKLKETIVRLQERLKSLNQPEEVDEEQIGKVKEFEDMQKLLELEWPESTFKVATINQGSMLTANREADLVVLFEESGETNDRNTRTREALTERYPELLEVGGSLASVRVSKVIEDNSGIRQTRETIIHKVEANSEQEWFKAIEGVKNRVVRDSRKYIALYPPAQDTRGVRTRKIVECLFRGTGIKCEIYCDQDIQGKRRFNEDMETMVVSQEGKSYSDMLRSIKEKIKPGTNAAEGIQIVRRTKDDNLLISVKKRLAMADIRTTLGGIGDVNILQDRKGDVLYIKDIDEGTTKEDVKSAVSREAGVQPERCWVGDFRPYYGGNKAVTIRLPKGGSTEKLASRGKIRIGLNLCNVMKRVDVDQCYRCWDFGHITKDCKGEDFSQACRRCGGKGHKARDCSEIQKCLNCKKEGHSTGSMQCPEFRKAINKARLK